MLTTSKSVLFPGHNHLLTTGTDDPSLAGWRFGINQSVGLSVPVVNRWLWPGNGSFLEVASMVVTWWIVAFRAVIIFIKFITVRAHCERQLCLSEVRIGLWMYAFQWHEMYCRDLEVMSSNPSWVELGVCSTSVLSRTWTKDIIYEM